MDLLQDARSRIDRIDGEMARLFQERMEAVADVAAYKDAQDLPVLDEAREEQVIQKNLERIDKEELKPFYRQYIQMQMDISKQYQARVLGRDRVAYQGVEGAFAHIALTRLFPQAKARSYPTWEEVFTAVEKGEAEYGVLPFENSSAGDVSQVLDLCYTHNLYITGMYDLPVQQNLLALHGAKLGDIKTVYSHPQGLSQSEQFLKSLHLESQSYPNTAAAAQYVAQSGDKTKAAIASLETARLYGLEVLVEQVNTEGTNTTRFIVVGRRLPNQGNRFSLLFTVDHKAGQLARVIQVIGQGGFNMECIKSRPMPHVPFEYYFYVELVGSPTADQSRQLLEQLGEICRTVRILGIFNR